MTRPVLLRCAPNGARSGFLQVRVGGKTTSLTVLPKVWRSALKARTLRASSGRWIVAHELDLLVFGADDAATVDAFADVAERAAQHEAAGSTDDGALERSEEGEEESHDDKPPAGAAHPGKREIEPIVRRIYGVKAVPTATPVAPDGSTASATFSLMALAMLCERLRDRSGSAALDHIHADSGDGAPSALASGTADNRVLELLRAWQFVQFVKARVRQVRHGYREEEDWLWTPRGRLLTEGLVRMEASGEPRALCRYDEFTPSTPLFRLVVTALERLAGAGAAQGALARTKLGEAIREEASRLRHALAFIPSAPAAQAVSAMRHARLGRLLRTWEPARAQAIEILERRSPDMAPRVGESDASLVWSVDMSKVWERLLADAVGAIAGNVAVPGGKRGLPVDCPEPWKGIGTSKSPDMVTVFKGVGWVLDAKYKPAEWSGGSPVIGQGDQYQLFAYSHLASIGGAPVGRLAILRPVHTGGQVRTLKEPAARNSATIGPARPTLSVADLPFPSRDAIPDDARFEHERHALTTALSAVLSA